MQSGGLPEVSDPVEHPAHYELPGGIEVYDVIAATQSRVELIGYCKGNVKKYVLRADRKGGPEDNRKARWYLDKLIELEDGMDRDDSRIGYEYGDVVASFEPERVWMTSDCDGTKVNVGMPLSYGLNGLLIDTDFETARHMVEGKVSLLVVVSDG